MKKRFLATIAIMAAALGVAIFSAGRAEASSGFSVEVFDSCRNVSFTVKNGQSRDIEIKQVKYFRAEKKRWLEENVENTLIPPNQTRTFGRDDLRDSEGERITKIKFVYEDKSDGKRKESQVFVPVTPECRAEKNFGAGQGWTITGPSEEQESDGLFSSDKCRNVEFSIINRRDEVIDIKKVKYFNRQSGKWKTTNIMNESVSARNAGNTIRRHERFGHNVNLPDADGDDITKIIFIYRYWTSDRRLTNWSPLVESQIFEPTDPRCHEGKVYGLGQGWTIGERYDPDSAASSDSTEGSESSTGNRRRKKKRAGTKSGGASKVAGPKVEGVPTPSASGTSVTTDNSNTRKRRKKKRQ